MKIPLGNISKCYYYLDINYSKLSELVDHLQSELDRQHQDSSSQAEQIEKSLNTLRAKLETSSGSAKTPGISF